MIGIMATPRSGRYFASGCWILTPFSGWRRGRGSNRRTPGSALAVLAGLWMTWGAVEQGKGWMDLPIYVTTALVLNTMLKLWVASEAGRRLGEDRKIGALELLLSTPLSVPDILRGQFLALRRQFLSPLILVLAIECVFLVAALRYSGLDAEGVPEFICVWVAGMILLVADLLALSAVGMWVGLTARNPNRATGITVVRVLVLPLVIGIVILIGATLIAYNSSAYEPGWKFMLVLWFGLGMVTDAVFGFEFPAEVANGVPGNGGATVYQRASSIWERLFPKGARAKWNTSQTREFALSRSFYPRLIRRGRRDG